MQGTMQEPCQTLLRRPKLTNMPKLCTVFMVKFYQNFKKRYASGIVET